MTYGRLPYNVLRQLDERANLARMSTSDRIDVVAARLAFGDVERDAHSAIGEAANAEFNFEGMEN